MSGSNAGQLLELTVWNSAGEISHETGDQKRERESRMLARTKLVKLLDDRLRILEDDDENLKGEFLKIMQERSELISEVGAYFKGIDCDVGSRNQESGETKVYSNGGLAIQHLKEEERSGLLQLLSQQSNPSLLTRALKCSSTSQTLVEVLETEFLCIHRLQLRRRVTMEIEVKLRLPDANAHQRLSVVLSPFHLKTHIQENMFFDGANSELSTNLAALRIRFYDLDSHCVLSLKAKPVLTKGISRIEEHEEPMDPSIGRACVAEPWRLLQMDSSDIMKRVREEYGLGDDDDNKLVCLGGFRNVRAVHEWNELKLELDETHYDFGTCYEVECETLEPERAKYLLEELLRSNGIQYSYSKANKFATFLSGELPQ